MTSTALLVMDVQQSIVDRFGDDEAYLPRLAAAVETARRAGIRVIYVVVGFRAGHPEVSERNKSFAAIPAPGDIIVTKRRVSAFTGSDLEVVLRAAGIDHLVLTGIATSGVVLSTLRQAADLDYRLTVLADGCLDADPEVHRVLTDKVYPRQADVLRIAEWTESLAKRAAG